MRSTTAAKIPGPTTYKSFNAYTFFISYHYKLSKSIPSSGDPSRLLASVGGARRPKPEPSKNKTKKARNRHRS